MKYAVIGDPLRQSVSDFMHSWMYEKLGLEAEYKKIKVPADGLERWVGLPSARKLSGFNVTIPHKTAIIPFLDEINAKLYIYLKTGGYLKPIYEFLENNYIREETYEIYVKWILGDLSKLDKRESIFKSMIRGVIKNYCSKFSLLSFAREMEIPSHVTVSEYLETFQSLLLVNNLYQVDLSKKTSRL